MKKIYTLLLLTSAYIFLTTLPTTAQWQLTNGPYGGEAGPIVISGTNVFAATGQGVFLSINNGASWKSISNNYLTENGASALAVSGTNIFAGTENAVLLSSDMGATWTTHTNGLPQSPFQVNSLTLAGTNILAIVSTGGNSGLFISADSGSFWTQLNTPASSSVSLLAVSGSNIFASVYGVGVFLSTDTCKSWTAFNNGLSNTDIFSLAISGNNIFAATDSGIYASNNNAANWAGKNNGLPIWPRIYSLGISGTNLLAGVAGYGEYISADSGSTWNASGFTNPNINYFTANGADVFAATLNGVFYSPNAGLSWSPVNNGLLAQDIITIASDGANIFAGTYSDGAYSSANAGASWTHTSNGLTLPTAVIAFAICSNNIISATENGMFLSTDGGATWNEITPESDIISFAVNGANIFAATNGSDELLLSTDSGLTWSYIYPGFSSSFNYSWAVSGTNVFVATDYGIYLTTDAGTTWTETDNGVNFSSQIYSIAIVGTNILAFTDNGEFSSANNGTSWTAVNNNFYGEFSSFAVSGSNIFAAGISTGAYLSIDNGNNWTSISQGLDSDFSYSTLAICGTNLFLGNGIGVWKRALSNIPYCSASFTIAADTTQPHHYIVTNNAYGTPPINYVWNWGDGTYSTIPFPNHTYADSGYYNICLSITDSTGCQSTYCDSSFHAMRTTNTMVYINVVNPLLTSTQVVNIQSPQLYIFPNPAHTQLTIQTPSPNLQKATLSIINTLGQQVLQSSIFNLQSSINVSSLPAGIYFLQLTNESNRWTGKFIKE